MRIIPKVLLNQVRPPRKIHLFIIRHATTDANECGVIQSHAQNSINNVGRRQAHELGELFANFTLPLDLLISSDLMRAIETAEIISGICNVAVVLDPRWRERQRTPYEGRLLSQYYLDNNDCIDDKLAIETKDGLVARIYSTLVEIPKKYKKVVSLGIVTHAGPCRAVLNMFINHNLNTKSGNIVPQMQDIDNCMVIEVLVHIRYGITTWSFIRVSGLGK